MKRRDFLTDTAALGIAMAASTASNTFAQEPRSPGGILTAAAAKTGNKLNPPATGRIPVAFAISQEYTLIDFAGPWEVFDDVEVKERGKDSPFQLFTVADKSATVTGSGGLKLVPDYTFENAPAPKIVVVPAQKGSEALYEWLRKVTETTDVTMSVCTGAFQLAKAGLLKGKSATTHHNFIKYFTKQFPDIDWKRGVRFVEGEKISTAGGLSSGIDLALRVVDRYFGREVAQATATYMEYQGTGWIV